MDQRKQKSLHCITIDGCSINTVLRYNLKTNYIGIYTTHRYQDFDKKKKYRDNNKEKLKEYNKQYYKDNCNLNTPKFGSKEWKIKFSCARRGIPIEDFDGFLKEQKYCKKFNEVLKTKIRNKYNNCDYISGIHKDICSSNCNLSVHHVNYDKDCGCNGTKCELIPLSRSNHIKTNGNRIFWNKLFIYALEIDKWYYEDE